MVLQNLAFLSTAANLPMPNAMKSNPSPSQGHYRWITEFPGCSTWTSKLAVSCLFGIGAYLLLLCTPWIPGGDDGWRHVKFAHRLATEGRAALADPWHLQYFWPKPIDGWFGYHLLLAPLTVAFGMITGTKILTSAVCAGIAYVLLALFEKSQVTWKLGWVFVATFGSGIVLYRALFCRPFLFSILLVLTATLFTLRRSGWGIFAVSIIHALCYSIVFLVALPVFVSLLFRRDRRSAVLAGSCLLGLCIGAALNPYFPENLHFYGVQTIAPITVGTTNDLDVGGELEPLSIWWIVSSFPVMVLYVSASIRLFWMRRRGIPGSDALLLFTMATLTLLVSLRMARMFDYFIPLALVFAAAVLSDWLVARANDAKYIAFFAFFFCSLNAFTTWRQVIVAPTPMKFKGISDYLLRQPSPSLIFNTHWGVYHFLYYLNSRDQYIVGIDPTFMYLMDAGRYWLWRHISNDEPVTCDQPFCKAVSKSISAAITEDFHAGYVIVDRAKNPHLDAYLGSSPVFKEVYRDSLTSLFVAERHP